jgi:hypothetical protein
VNCIEHVFGVGPHVVSCGITAVIAPPEDVAMYSPN